MKINAIKIKLKNDMPGMEEEKSRRTHFQLSAYCPLQTHVGFEPMLSCSLGPPEPTKRDTGETDRRKAESTGSPALGTWART